MKIKIKYENKIELNSGEITDKYHEKNINRSWINEENTVNGSWINEDNTAGTYPAARQPVFWTGENWLDQYKLCRGVTGRVPKYFLNNNSFT